MSEKQTLVISFYNLPALAWETTAHLRLSDTISLAS
jgi:hypothetical protein